MSGVTSSPDNLRDSKSKTGPDRREGLWNMEEDEPMCDQYITTRLTELEVMTIVYFPETLGTLHLL